MYILECVWVHTEIKKGCWIPQSCYYRCLWDTQLVTQVLGSKLQPSWMHHLSSPRYRMFKCPGDYVVKRPCPG